MKSIVNAFALIAIVTEPFACTSPTKSTSPWIESRKPDWIETQLAARHGPRHGLPLGPTPPVPQVSEFHPVSVPAGQVSAVAGQEGGPAHAYPLPGDMRGDPEPGGGTDPRVQGAGFFYIAPAVSSLLPGMNVTATLPVGDSVAATIIPRSAVLWGDDGAWIYVQRTPSSYVRRPISTDVPTPEGYAVTGLPSGTRVVVRGAQLLLSQESRAQIPSGDEDDTH